MTYKSTKTYDHNLGLSATFRQWKAQSHCRHLHGYALAFRFEFQALRLDDRNWVVDFGGLKELKRVLEVYFDHKLVIAFDDPQKVDLLRLAKSDLCDPVVLPAVGCEAFAEFAFKKAAEIVNDARVQVISCECMEHAGNSAIYTEPFALHPI
jgi:6-pyruvoyltetrahydropterin/6-carboxytetrahydropterin synthase